MSSMDETLKVINELINAGGEVSLPGLELDSVAENFVNEKYGVKLEEIENKKEREKLRKKWLTYYKEGEGKQTMLIGISEIKSLYGAAENQLSLVAEAAKSAVASNSIPSVITVGSASSTPNLAYVYTENKTKKNQLLAMLKQVGVFLVNLLKAAAEIAFAIPQAVLDLIKTAAEVEKSVNAIPV